MTVLVAVCGPSQRLRGDGLEERKRVPDPTHALYKEGEMKCDPTVCRTVGLVAAGGGKMSTKAPIATQCGDTAKSEKLTEGRSSFRRHLHEAARKDIHGAFLLHKETRLWPETLSPLRSTQAFGRRSPG